MKTKTKIIVGSISAVLLLIFLVIVGIFGFFVYVGGRLENPALKQKTAQAKADGAAFGKTTDQNGCIEKGYLLEAPTDSFDMSSQKFLNECLNASRPSTDFCEGVPFVFDRQWFDEQCKKVGHNDDSCINALIAKRNYCQMGGKK